MANPSGKTYRFTEHNPANEPNGPHFVYKDGGSSPQREEESRGQPAAQARSRIGEQASAVREKTAQAWENVKGQAEQTLSATGNVAASTGDTCARLVRNNPMMAFVGAIAVGFLVGRMIA